MVNNETIPTIDSLFRRAEIFLEDHEWSSASEYYNKILDIEPENVKAYIGLLLSALRLTNENQLIYSEEAFLENSFFQKAMRFATPEYAQTLHQYAIQNIYLKAQNIMADAQQANDFYRARALLLRIADSMPEATALADKCSEKMAKFQQQEKYNSIKLLMEDRDVKKLKQAVILLKELQAEEYADDISECESIIAEIEKEKAKKKKRIGIIVATTIGVIVTITLIILAYITNENEKRAMEIQNNFIGQEFYGSKEDDDGFAHDYFNNNLAYYLTYWKSVEKHELKFNEDGSVYYKNVYDKTVLAHPKNSPKPDPYHYEYDGELTSFSVFISLNGTIYLTAGGDSYIVSVDENNVPKSIYSEYDHLTLT